MRYLGYWLGGLMLLIPAIQYLGRWTLEETVASLALAFDLGGIPHTVSGHVLTIGTARMEIVTECTPLIPSLLLCIGIVGYPAETVWKLVGVVGGLAALWIFNVLRMLTLISLLLWNPVAFSVVHVYIWSVLTLSVVCGLFAIWMSLGKGERFEVAWLGRFLGWATLLVIPIALCTLPYHRQLARAADAMWRLFGHDLQILQIPRQVPYDVVLSSANGRRLTIEIIAPFDVLFFMSMCLASVHVPVVRRLKALLSGIPLLALLTWGMLIAWGWMFVWSNERNGTPVFLQRARDGITTTLPWVSAPALWWALLGWDQRRRQVRPRTQSGG